MKHEPTILRDGILAFLMRGGCQRSDLPEEARIQKTVFIKAPKSVPYGEVVKVLDGIKGAGAEPIGLQVDELD